MAVSDTPDTPETSGSAPATAVDTFSALLTDEGQHLLEQLAGFDPGQELALATRLRRNHPAPLVTAALAQAHLRQRAVAKFTPDDAARMYFTPAGLEQATRAPVATHRAQRFAERGARRVADLGCGVGGDALALARAGMRVLAVDRDPLTCAVARANAETLGLSDHIEVQCADVTSLDVTSVDAMDTSDTGHCDAIFADPARRRGGSRGGGGRVFGPEAYKPPLSWAIDAARRADHAALKVAPGIPHETIPEDAEAEWVSHRGDVKEAVLWFGGDTPSEPAVRATLLPGGHTLARTDDPAESSEAPATGPVGPYLYEPDGAVIRAHLVAEAAAAVDGRLIDPTIAYIAADSLRPTPYATAYEVTDVLPFHVKRLRALLRERGIGTLTVKKRGSAVEPEELRRKLKPSGPNTATVFLTRVAGAPTMLLAHPTGPA